MLLKVIKANNVLFVIICILIMGQNFMGHDLLVLCLNIGNITNITVKWIDYFCINFNITNLIQFICWEINWLIMVHYIKCRSKKLLWKTELLFCAFKHQKKRVIILWIKKKKKKKKKKLETKKFNQWEKL